MNRPVLALALALTGAAALAATPVTAQTPAPGAAAATTTATADPAAVVARIGEAEITNADVTAAYQDLPAQYRQLPLATLYRQLLNQLVNRQLMLRAGLAQKLDEDAAILAEIRQFRDFAIQRAYLDRYLKSKVTDAVLRAEYDATVGTEKGKEEVKASHILLQSEDEARTVIGELADGADFADLARKKSTGPSGPKGGDLGFFGREQMVAPFSEAAFAMEEGETSAAPVKTQFGWHVIKVTARRTLPPPTFDEVREQINDRLTRSVLEAHMAELRGATTVEMFNPDGTPMEPAATK